MPSINMYLYTYLPFHDFQKNVEANCSFEICFLFLQFHLADLRNVALGLSPGKWVCLQETAVH